MSSELIGAGHLSGDGASAASTAASTAASSRREQPADGEEPVAVLLASVGWRCRRARGRRRHRRRGHRRRVPARRGRRGRSRGCSGCGTRRRRLRRRACASRAVVGFVEGGVDGQPDRGQRDGVRLVVLARLRAAAPGRWRSTSPAATATIAWTVVVVQLDGARLAARRAARRRPAGRGTRARGSPRTPRRRSHSRGCCCSTAGASSVSKAGMASPARPVPWKRSGERPQQPQAELGVAFGGPRQRGDEIVVVGVDHRDDVVGRTGDAEPFEPVAPPRGRGCRGVSVSSPASRARWTANARIVSSSRYGDAASGSSASTRLLSTSRLIVSNTVIGSTSPRAADDRLGGQQRERARRTHRVGAAPVAPRRRAGRSSTRPTPPRSAGGASPSAIRRSAAGSDRPARRRSARCSGAGSGPRPARRRAGCRRADGRSGRPRRRSPR